MVLTSVKRPFSSVRPQLVVLAFIFMVAFVFLLSHNVKDQKSWSTGMLVQAMHAVKLPESSTEEEERHRYNLVDPQDLVRMRFNMMDCTTERMNEQKMAQDHPCVIDIIRRQFLHPPASANEPYNLYGGGEHIDYDPSSGQSRIILDLLKNKTRGFFVECGANDGQFLSNTLRMERAFEWSGLLIEADPYTYYEQLLARKRKAWTLPACLSLEPYPTRVPFRAGKDADGAYNVIMSDTSPENIEKLRGTHLPVMANDTTTIAQCFPLYSILLAANRTQLDFLSLDIEGHELKVLQTIPWSKVDISTMAVESVHVLEGEDTLRQYMENNGYTNHTLFKYQSAWDFIFVKNGLKL